MLKRLKRFLIGRPLASNKLAHESIPKWKALAVLSSDALSSVAYATEEALIPLATIGIAAFAYSIPIALAIVVLLILITLSYRQTIDAYPNGGGAYIVAKENLGQVPGLIAGGALLIDYVLTVSVSVASGIENLSSALPWLQAHQVLMGLAVIFLLMMLNLRGLSESSFIMAIPCYLFIVSIIVMVIVGIFRAHTATGIVIPNILEQHYPEISILLLLKAFSSGCSALTGVEAISNGVQVFRDPKQHNAKATMAIMALLLGLMFAGITYLAHVYKLAPGGAQTLISQLASTVFGHSTFMYFVVQVAVALILFLAASTSYADFPRLSSLLALDKYAPRQLAMLGDRLVFSNGIVGLSFAAGLLIVLFGGHTHHLIPLYAVGVFLSFTLSQSGMVVHHLRLREKNWQISIIFNALGLVTTAVVLVVIAMSKFEQGAWMVILLIPCIVFVFARIHKHYQDCARELSNIPADATYEMQVPHKQVVILPISGVHRGVIDALFYAKSITDDVRICFVEIDARQTAALFETLPKFIDKKDIVILKSPFRSVITPLIKYVDKAAKTQDGNFITVVLPEFVTAKWYHQFLHNQTALIIKAALMFKPRVVVTSVRHHLKST